ncbi:hypothetical protein WS71_03875 [Burkholderia mayonis]|uniref:Uncharacterized protein n=1 Tax=Burkholderia mayonis TaxID=1385591 RepID=A0A1B4FS97_9BURK|nr:hypothetical protein WS71_03875 [Burkholderia mayonis]KVE51223.1 hypothetical protein WS71_12965 [Burkholderia mayonis]
MSNAGAALAAALDRRLRQLAGTPPRPPAFRVYAREPIASRVASHHRMACVVKTRANTVPRRAVPSLQATLARTHVPSPRSFTLRTTDVDLAFVIACAYAATPTTSDARLATSDARHR